MKYEQHRTGICQLDEILLGGLPSGVCEVIGEDASGKSTLCLSVMREASIGGFPTALIHSESFPDPTYTKSAGPHECLSIIPNSLESAIEAAYSSLQNGVKIVTIDSLSSIEPLCDQKLSVKDRVPFAVRRAAYHGLSYLREEALKREALVLVINQLRTPVQALVPRPCSALEGTINNLCSVRVKTRREKTRNEYGKLAYLRVRFDIFRSLVCPPSDRACGFLFNQKGFRRGFELMRVLLSSNIFEQTGSYLKRPDGISLGPGYLEAANQIEENFAKYWRYYDGGSQSDDS